MLDYRQSEKIAFLHLLRSGWLHTIIRLLMEHKMDIKYIGIPYKLHGRDFTGCDCYGLVYLYMLAHGYTLPKYDFSYTLETREKELTVERALLLGEQIDKPQELSIVLFYKRNRPIHVGVFTQGGVLHTTENRDSMFENIHSPKLKRFSKMEYYSVNESYYTAESF